MNQITVEIKKEGWYEVGVNLQYHYFRKSKTETKSRCGKTFQCELKFVNGVHRKLHCSSCLHLLQHDDYNDNLVEPHRY